VREDAANTVASVLIDGPIRGIKPNRPPDPREEAFRLLTGVDSPWITE